MQIWEDRGLVLEPYNMTDIPSRMSCSRLNNLLESKPVALPWRLTLRVLCPKHLPRLVEKLSLAVHLRHTRCPVA